VSTASASPSPALPPAAVSVARVETALSELRATLVMEAPPARRPDVALLLDEAERHVAAAVTAAKPIAKVRVEAIQEVTRS
jgi:hypothetical protein